METAVFGAGPGFREMGRSQDLIGWRRFMEGMISKEILPLQEDHPGAILEEESPLSPAVPTATLFRFYTFGV